MKARLIQLFAICVSITTLIGVLFFVNSAIDAKRSQVKRPKPIAKIEPYVSILPIETASYQPTLSAFGNAEPRYSLTLNSQASGKVLNISSHFEVGQRVKKGQVLAQIDNIDYKVAVANNQYQVATAELALKEEERTAQQAKDEWEASGIKDQPASDLLLRKPQLVAAKAALQDAQISLEQAQQSLQDTQIKAPFDALIVERLIVPGSYVQSGSEVATLYSVDRMDIKLSISINNWEKLVPINVMSAKRWPVLLSDVESKVQWQGYVLGAENHRDSNTRMRTLIVSIDAPLDQSAPLLPGSFLQANFAGKKIDGLWELPSTALSQKSDVWVVTPDNTLLPINTVPTFSNNGYIYIKPPTNLSTEAQQVVIRPYNSYLQGMKVKPQTKDGTILIKENVKKEKKTNKKKRTDKTTRSTAQVGDK